LEPLDLIHSAPPEAHAELLRRLVSIERDQRRKLGRPLTATEARQRFASLGTWAERVLNDLGLESDAAQLTLDIVAGPHQGQSFRLAGHTTCSVGRGPAAVHLALERDVGMSRLH